MCVTCPPATATPHGCGGLCAPGVAAPVCSCPAVADSVLTSTQHWRPERSCTADAILTAAPPHWGACRWLNCRMQGQGPCGVRPAASAGLWLRKAGGRCIAVSVCSCTMTLSVQATPRSSAAPRWPRPLCGEHALNLSQGCRLIGWALRYSLGAVRPRLQCQCRGQSCGAQGSGAFWVSHRGQRPVPRRVPSGSTWVSRSPVRAA